MSDNCDLSSCAVAHEQLTLYEKILDMSAYAEIALTQSSYPRSQRFLLCSDIRDTISNILHLTIRAMKRYFKKTTLQDLDIEVEYLRALIRISEKKKYITLHRKQVWILKVNEIGRMIGGWIKTNSK